MYHFEGQFDHVPYSRVCLLVDSYLYEDPQLQEFPRGFKRFQERNEVDDCWSFVNLHTIFPTDAGSDVDIF